MGDFTVEEMLAMQRYGSILWKKWRMCSCITMMSFDVLLCYGISEQELKEAYTAKFEKNMTRW